MDRCVSECVCVYSLFQPVVPTYIGVCRCTVCLDFVYRLHPGPYVIKCIEGPGANDLEVAYLPFQPSIGVAYPLSMDWGSKRLSSSTTLSRLRPSS